MVETHVLGYNVTTVGYTNGFIKQEKRIKHSKIFKVKG